MSDAYYENDFEETIKLPCGCIMKARIDRYTKTVTFTPCSPTCTNYANIVELARKEGKPVRFKEP